MKLSPSKELNTLIVVEVDNNSYNECTALELLLHNLIVEGEYSPKDICLVIYRSTTCQPRIEQQLVTNIDLFQQPINDYLITLITQYEGIKTIEAETSTYLRNTVMREYWDDGSHEDIKYNFNFSYLISELYKSSIYYNYGRILIVKPHSIFYDNKTKLKKILPSTCSLQNMKGQYDVEKHKKYCSFLNCDFAVGSSDFILLNRNEITKDFAKTLLYVSKLISLDLNNTQEILESLSWSIALNMNFGRFGTLSDSLVSYDLVKDLGWDSKWQYALLNDHDSIDNFKPTTKINSTLIDYIKKRRIVKLDRDLGHTWTRNYWEFFVHKNTLVTHKIKGALPS